MSVRGFFPLVIGGGLAYWAYTKKEEEAEELEDEEGELDVLSALASELAADRAAAAKEETTVEAEVEVTSESINRGPATRKKKSNAKR